MQMKLKPLFKLLFYFGVSAIVWVSVSPPNSYVEMLTPKEYVLGGESFERCLGHGSGAFTNGISAFTKRDHSHPFMWRHWEIWIPKRALPWPWWHLDLRLPAPRLWAVNFCCSQAVQSEVFYNSDLSGPSFQVGRLAFDSFPYLNIFLSFIF